MLFHLEPCVFPPRSGSFSAVDAASPGLAVAQKAGQRADDSPFTHLFQMTSSPAPDTQKAVCIVTTWPSPPQGRWSVEAPHSGRLLVSALL